MPTKPTKPMSQEEKDLSNTELLALAAERDIPLSKTTYDSLRRKIHYNQTNNPNLSLKADKTIIDALNKNGLEIQTDRNEPNHFIPACNFPTTKTSGFTAAGSLGGSFFANYFVNAQYKLSTSK